MFSALVLSLILQPEIRHGLPPRTVVLTYHDVIPTRDSSALWFDCTTSELESQLTWMLSKGVHFISLDQLYGHLTRGLPLPKHPVAVTFADNYLGFWERAYPILKRRHIPTAMFVHTGFVGDRSHGRSKMDWGQLSTLDREGLVTICSQTVTHPADLRLLTSQKVDQEMLKSKIDLEHHLGHPIRFLAYPNGKFGPSTKIAAKRDGYLMAFSEETHPAEASPSIFAVNRYVHTKYRRAISDGGKG